MSFLNVKNNASSTLFGNNITLLTVSDTISEGINIDAGNVTLKNITVGTASNVTDIIHVEGSSSLVTIDGVTSNFLYTYDPVGNRLSNNGINYSYDANDRLLDA